MLYLITPLTTPLGSGITRSVHTIWKTLLILNQHFYWIVLYGTSLVKWLMVYGQMRAYQLKLAVMTISIALEISYGETNSIILCLFCILRFMIVRGFVHSYLQTKNIILNSETVFCFRNSTVTQCRIVNKIYAKF